MSSDHHHVLETERQDHFTFRFQTIIAEKIAVDVLCVDILDAGFVA
ncbi:MAG: hypothetical protein IIB54_16220 [Planctomycetes bacterium]|nr:hypothetical protein [Planctomycetota bacterium]